MTIEDSVKLKDPQDTIALGFDWSDLIASGLYKDDVINSYTLSTTASGITITNDYNTSASVIFFASGGEAGKRYNVVCTIVTTPGGETIERTMKIDVRNR